MYKYFFNCEKKNLFDVFLLLNISLLYKIKFFLLQIFVAILNFLCTFATPILSLKRPKRIE